jgi:hypothetical protein
MLNGQTRLAINSLAYFTSLINEVAQPEIPASYWEHVRRKMEEMEKRWLQLGRSGPTIDVIPAEPHSPEMI